jgi:hypothetical protein
MAPLGVTRDGGLAGRCRIGRHGERKRAQLATQVAPSGGSGVKRLLIGLGLLLSAALIGPSAAVDAQTGPAPSPTPTLRPIVLPTARPTAAPAAAPRPAPRAGGFPIEVALPLLAGGGAAAIGGSALLLRRRGRS